MFEDFDGLKNKQKAYEVMFFDMQKCMYSESLFNTRYIQTKKYFSDKMNITKNALVSLKVCLEGGGGERGEGGGG